MLICVSVCRVHGLVGLRVVDESVIPHIISGDLYAASVMIAEKAADVILSRTTVQSPPSDKSSS